MNSIAIFGGTFDPVHNGHVQTCLTIQSHFNFDSFYFLPCKIPTIKPPALADNQQRIKMIQLAIKKHTCFNIDLREINRETPSYMIETLQSFRLEHENASISLIMGYDTFLSLPQWHQWTKIIELTNLLVINRNQYSNHTIPEVINNLMNHHKNDTEEMLLKNKAGTICLFNAGNYLISSTDIRQKIKQHQDVTNSLPKDVHKYIRSLELYQ